MVCSVWVVLRFVTVSPLHDDVRQRGVTTRAATPTVTEGSRALTQDKSWVLIWELRELALNGSCREAMLEGGAVSILAALMAEDDLPAPAKANAAAALKVGRPAGG